MNSLIEDNLKYFCTKIKENPKQLLREIFDFLGVDNEFIPDMSTRFNISGIPKNKLIHKDSVIKDLFKRIVANQETRRKLKERIMNRNLAKPTLVNSI
ncbi:hypothetical protein [Aeribacillus alveayuensis]|uniref:Sulfotransferase domain-containing protein n=1 Tax=Aeribacillus alveayuensis TaxID=279215 RepID=A0ABT9VNJ9_9BACI|nr:hypothetical protein [Bacillus alveayuensis]